MIFIVFTLKNPFSKQEFENVYSKSGSLSKHKAWEVEVYKTKAVVDFDFDLSFRQDHAGIRLGLGLFGYTVSGHIYDTRHWNYNEDRWYVYEDGEEK